MAVNIEKDEEAEDFIMKCHFFLAMKQCTVELRVTVTLYARPV